MHLTKEEIVKKLTNAGLVPSKSIESSLCADICVLNPQDNYTVGYIDLSPWNNKEPIIYEIKSLYCSDYDYVHEGGYLAFIDQAINGGNHYTRRSVKKDDLDGFIAMCKDFIGWINTKYSREYVLEKERRERERLRRK
ncbi:MAG: hypothetical protein II850_07240 [Fibrobacter sp.]|nr:hypothetical protein [Fibrobacter sp.]